MNLLDLISQDTTLRKETISSLAGACPSCGGRDRFVVRPGDNRWWCRQCSPRGGDTIAYLRQFHGMKYREACEYLGQEPRERTDYREPKQRTWSPRESKTLSLAWQEKATRFLQWTEGQLWAEGGKGILKWLQEERGLELGTIRRYRLGLNPQDWWLSRESWGLSKEIKDNGRLKKLWLPAGLVIPLLQGDQVARLRIRRPRGEPRYILVPGSSSDCLATGRGRYIVVVESELDAILLGQEAGDLVTVLSLGSAQARPDRRTYELLCQAEGMLIALDSDCAGVKETWTWWQEHFPRATRWPVTSGKDTKDTTEAWKQGVDLRGWIMAGIMATWGTEKREAWEEQAAIGEYEGGLDRGEAERSAFLCMVGQ